MNSIFGLVVLSFLSTSHSVPTDSNELVKRFDGDEVWRVVPQRHKDVKFLQILEQEGEDGVDFWKDPFRKGFPVDIHIAKEEIVRLKKAFKEHGGMSIEVIVPNLQKLIDEERSSMGLRRRKRALSNDYPLENTRYQRDDSSGSTQRSWRTEDKKQEERSRTNVNQNQRRHDRIQRTDKNQRHGDRYQNTEGRNQLIEDRQYRTDGKDYRSGNSNSRTEDPRQRNNDRGIYKTEDRAYRTADKTQRTVDRDHRTEDKIYRSEDRDERDIKVDTEDSNPWTDERNEEQNEMVDLSNYERLQDLFLSRVNHTWFSHEDFINRFNNHSEINDWLRQIAYECGSRCSLHTIGYSGEDRELLVIKIQGTRNKTRSAIWIDGGIHGREWISPAMAINIIYKLVMDYKTDRCTRHIVEAYDWYILPVVNPDGYHYSMTRNRMWRKNRKQIEAPQSRNTWWFYYYGPQRYCYGVDLNRNFGFYWGETGTSKNPCSDIYGGSTAFSEPESVAIKTFLEQLNSVKIYLSLHSYGQFWLYSWGYTRVLTEDHRDLDRLANYGADAILQASGRRTSYTVGAASRTLYASSGASDDWAKGALGIKYSYTIELPPSDSEVSGNGFVLPESRIASVAAETWPGIRAMAVEALKMNKPGHRDHNVCS